MVGWCDYGKEKGKKRWEEMQSFAVAIDVGTSAHEVHCTLDAGFFSTPFVSSLEIFCKHLLCYLADLAG